jgi:hypothetical protein
LGVDWAFGGAVGLISYVWACKELHTAKTSRGKYPIFRYASLAINESPANFIQIKGRWKTNDKAQGIHLGCTPAVNWITQVHAKVTETYPVTHMAYRATQGYM